MQEAPGRKPFIYEFAGSEWHIEGFKPRPRLKILQAELKNTKMTAVAVLHMRRPCCVGKLELPKPLKAAWLQLVPLKRTRLFAADIITTSQKMIRLGILFFSLLSSRPFPFFLFGVFFFLFHSFCFLPSLIW